MNSFIQVQIRLEDLAKLLECKFKGDPDAQIRHIGDINYLVENKGPFRDNCIYFVNSDKLLPSLPETNAEFVILGNPGVASHFKNVILTESQPRVNFIRLLEFFQSKISNPVNSNEMVHPGVKIPAGTTIAPGVYLGEGVELGANCTVYANAVIEPFSRIGDNTVIHSGAFIGRHSVIGSHCIIYPNAVIGADGFGYIDEDATRYKIPQIGNVALADYVEIGAGTTIDRSTIESTTVGSHTKIDNQVQIAHNCVIGQYVYIAGKASLAGSVKVHDRAILAGGCGIRDHVRIAEGSVILAFTGIEEDTQPNQTYFGIPARKVREMHRIHSALTHLPELVKAARRNRG